MPMDWQKEEEPSLVGPIAENGGARCGSPERVSDANAAGTPVDDGEAEPGARPSNTHLASSPEVQESPDFKALLRQAVETMLLQPDGYSGPLEDIYFIPNAVAAIDWLEESMLVSWDGVGNDDLFFKLHELQESARSQQFPEQYELAGQVVAVHPLGVGSGRQQRLELRLDWPGVMLAFSRSGGKDRQHANLLLKITGEACLLQGALAVRELVDQMIEELGGIVTDRWLRRIDLCLDLPEVSIDDWLVPAFVERRFLTSASHWNLWDGKQGNSGFTVGNMKSVTMNVYDKLRHTLKQSEAYQLGMCQNRWCGTGFPVSATRVEYQIRKAWMDQFGLNRSDYVLECLPAILSRLTELKNRPFFAMTATEVDRRNKHQGRAERHPEWQRLVATFRTLVGSPAQPLKKIDRSLITQLRACRMMIGFATSSAAQMGVCLETREHVLEHLATMMNLNDISDEEVAEKFRRKALAAGTLREPESFDFGCNLKGGSDATHGC